MVKDKNSKTEKDNFQKLSSIIAVEKAVLKQLLQIKLDKDFGSINEVIIYLIKNNEK